MPCGKLALSAMILPLLSRCGACRVVLSFCGLSQRSASPSLARTAVCRPTFLWRGLGPAFSHHGAAARWIPYRAPRRLLDAWRALAWRRIAHHGWPICHGISCHTSLACRKCIGHSLSFTPHRVSRPPASALHRFKFGCAAGVRVLLLGLVALLSLDPSYGVRLTLYLSVCVCVQLKQILK
jgi:hypothetical protein